MMRRVADNSNVKDFVEELADKIESSGDVSYVSDVHEREDAGQWAFTIAGKNRRINVIIDDSKDEAIISPIYYDDEFPVTDEVSTPIDFSDIDDSCNSILDVAKEFDFPASSDLKASYRKAADYRSFEPKERDVDGWDVKPRNSPFERPKSGWYKSDFGLIYDPSPKSYTYGLVTNEVEDLGLPAGDKKDGQWLAVIMDERRDLANNLPEDAIDAEAFTTMREARAWVESWFAEHEQNDVFASKKQASNHKVARGFHSRWNESDMYDFVKDAVDDINRHTYSDIMARNINSYEGDDGEVYTFDIMSDYFSLYVEVDGTNVSISCDEDPSLDQAWDFDEDYSSSNLAEDLFSIASDAEEVFIEMSEEEASEGFDF